MTATGSGSAIGAPTARRSPVSGSRRKTTTESEFWLAAISQRPVGSTAKLRGVRPPLGTHPAGESLPVSSAAKTARLSFPRFEA